MKARVYGWAVNINTKTWEWYNGSLKIDCLKKHTTDSFIDLNGFVYHKCQVEPIKEITITEEDFDNAWQGMLDSVVGSYDFRLLNSLLKQELFKELK